MPFWYIRGMFQNSPNTHAVHACSIPVICPDHSSLIPLIDLHDHRTDQIDSLATPLYYKGCREGIDLICGVITPVYKRNKRRMIEAYYEYATGVNGMDIRGILEHSPNIPKGHHFIFQC